MRSGRDGEIEIEMKKIDREREIASLSVPVSWKDRERLESEIKARLLVPSLISRRVFWSSS